MSSFNAPADWNKLDNAAKIFPPTSNQRDTKVFRFACQLREPVDRTLLQQALDRTLPSFPLWRCVLKHGLFWYYLEESQLEAVVEEENAPACGPLYDPNHRSLLFEVTYWDCRINLEVYHALTDGTGALQFLRQLVSEYLQLRHPESFPQPLSLHYDASTTQKAEDSFLKYYNPKGSAPSQDASPKKVRACQLRGPRVPEGRLRVIEGILPVKGALELAKKNDATLTVLLASALVLALAQELPVRALEKRPVTLTVPVNLRNYFASETARNFFGTIQVPVRVSREQLTLEEIIPQVRQVFLEELTAQRLGRRMNALSRAEHNFAARAVPLVLKDCILRIANWKDQGTITASLSNIGRVQMPPEADPFIRRFDVFVSAPKLSVCVCSYGGELTVSFTSAFRSTNVPMRFFRILTGAGLPVEIQSNEID